MTASTGLAPVFHMKEIYADNAAATPIAPEAIRAYVRAASVFGNPSSFNDAGRRASELLTDARARIARFLNARGDEIVLCASGSEANTLAIRGVMTARPNGSVCVADTEHLSVLEAVRGFTRVTIPVDAVGRVSHEDVGKLLTRSVSLVSVMYANNEIGTINPVARIGRIIAQWRREHRSAYPLFHVDACQATTTLDMDVQRIGADLLTLNGAKAYGPHGAAVLYVRRGTALEPQVRGGSQQGGRRAGTEDVAGACSLAAALETIRPAHAVKLTVLRDRLIAGILAAVPDARLNGPTGSERLAGNVHVSVPGCDSENLLLELDRKGIRAGSGSACTAHSVLPSHVLTAVGTPKLYLDGALRLSLGRNTTRADVDAIIRVLPGIVGRVRARRRRTGRSS